MFGNQWFRKESPLLSMIGLGGGAGGKLTAGSAGQFMEASGGSESTSGDYKIHTFTASGNFVVTTAPTDGYTVEYLIIAGGGGGANNRGGGGGAGGQITNYPSPDTGGVSVSAQTYPIVVGAGANPMPNDTPSRSGLAGNNSSGFSLTALAGGYGSVSHNNPDVTGGPGGCGGGAGYTNGTAGPATNYPGPQAQGYPGGGTGGSASGGGGGGGTASAGGACNGTGGGDGGNGTNNGITGSTQQRGGGGGGSADAAGGNGGQGGGGQGSASSAPAGDRNGADGTGSGGGGVRNSQAGAGGDGIVIVRYKYQ